MVGAKDLDSYDIVDSRLVTWRFFLNLSLEENIFIFVDSYYPNLLLLSQYVNKLIISCNDKRVLSNYKIKIASSCIMNVVLLHKEEVVRRIDAGSISVFICYSGEYNNGKFIDHVNSLICLFKNTNSCKQFLYNVKNPFVMTGDKRNKLYFIAKILIGLIRVKTFNNRNINVIKKCGESFPRIIYFSVGPVGEATCIYGNSNVCCRYYNDNFTSSEGNRFFKKIIYNIITFTGVNKILSEEFLYLCRK